MEKEIDDLRVSRHTEIVFCPIFVYGKLFVICLKTETDLLCLSSTDENIEPYNNNNVILRLKLENLLDSLINIIVI